MRLWSKLIALFGLVVISADRRKAIRPAVGPSQSSLLEDEKSLREIEREMDGKAVDYAIEELKIIQDKIDKLGDFKFKIKAWCVTLVLAGLLGGKSVNLGALGITYLSSIPLLLWNLEAYFSKQSQAFGDRAKDIEEIIGRLQISLGIRGKLRRAGRVPGLAGWIQLGGLKPKLPKNAGWWRRRWYLLNSRAESVFYIGLIASVIGWAWLPKRQGNDEKLADALCLVADGYSRISVLTIAAEKAAAEKAAAEKAAAEKAAAEKAAAEKAAAEKAAAEKAAAEKATAEKASKSLPEDK